MHAAKLSKSDRLKRVARYLADKKPHSTLDIINGASVCAVNSIVAELRANGAKIHCQRTAHIWYYTMTRKAA